MSVFAIAARAIFSDPNGSELVLWGAGGGDAKEVRAIVRAPDQVESFGSLQIQSDTLILSVLVEDVPAPAEGDAVQARGTTRVVQGEPRKDDHGLIWSIDTAPVS